jgi:hypothetical protein
VHFYGYDQDSFDFGKDTINQIFNDFNGRIGFSTDRRKFQFNSNFDFYTFSNLDGRENDFMVTLNPVLKLPKKQRIDLGFAIDYTTLGSRTVVPLSTELSFGSTRSTISMSKRSI